MSTIDALKMYLESLDDKNYYDILRVPKQADADGVKAAFHHFSLLYHPDRYVDGGAETGQIATAIFKRGVEAYRCLSRGASRARYDRALARGHLRVDAARPSSAPPPVEVRTLETIARTADGRKFALQADRLLAIGKLEGARVQFASACQSEPYNEELAERLRILYDALALEPQ